MQSRRCAAKVHTAGTAYSSLALRQDSTPAQKRGERISSSSIDQQQLQATPPPPLTETDSSRSGVSETAQPLEKAVAQLKAEKWQVVTHEQPGLAWRPHPLPFAPPPDLHTPTHQKWEGPHLFPEERRVRGTQQSELRAEAVDL